MTDSAPQFDPQTVDNGDLQIIPGTEVTGSTDANRLCLVPWHSDPTQKASGQPCGMGKDDWCFKWDDDASWHHASDFFSRYKFKAEDIEVPFLPDFCEGWNTNVENGLSQDLKSAWRTGVEKERWHINTSKRNGVVVGGHGNVGSDKLMRRMGWQMNWKDAGKPLRKQGVTSIFYPDALHAMACNGDIHDSHHSPPYVKNHQPAQQNVGFSWSGSFQNVGTGWKSASRQSGFEFYNKGQEFGAYPGMVGGLRFEISSCKEFSYTNTSWYPADPNQRKLTKYDTGKKENKWNDFQINKMFLVFQSLKNGDYQGIPILPWGDNSASYGGVGEGNSRPFGYKFRNSQEGADECTSGTEDLGSKSFMGRHSNRHNRWIPINAFVGRGAVHPKDHVFVGFTMGVWYGNQMGQDEWRQMGIRNMQVIPWDWVQAYYGKDGQSTNGVNNTNTPMRISYDRVNNYNTGGRVEQFKRLSFKYEPGY